MKGGGLTWVGWLMVGVGGMLVYAGMTGQSLVDEISAVINGRSIPKGTAGTDSASMPTAPAAPPQTVPARDPFTVARALPNTVISV